MFYGSSTFLDVVNYIASKKPRAFILENVRFTPYAGINEKGGGEILRLHAAIDVIFRRHTALFCYRCGIPPVT